MSIKNEDIRESYKEDTIGRKHHTSIITKPKERIEDTPEKIHTVYLNRPILWKEFKKLPNSLKKMYIEHLRDTYHASQTEIRAMLTCGAATIHRCFTELNLIGTFPRGNAKKTKKQIKAWNAFLNNTETTEDSTPATPTEHLKGPESNTKPNSTTIIQNFSFTQSGPFNMDEFIKKIAAFITEGEECTITLNMHTPKVIHKIYEQGHWGSAPITKFQGIQGEHNEN